MITLGYQRPLQASDLWRMDSTREAGTLSEKLDQAWARRVADAKDWNTRLASGEIQPSVVRRSKWYAKALVGRGSYKSQEEHWRNVEGRKEASLAWALNDVLGLAFWLGGGLDSCGRVPRSIDVIYSSGLFKVAGDTAQLMGPLISKSLINFGKERAARKAAGEEPPDIGRGFGMAIGMGLLTITFSVCTHQVSDTTFSIW